MPLYKAAARSFSRHTSSRTDTSSNQQQQEQQQQQEATMSPNGSNIDLEQQPDEHTALLPNGTAPGQGDHPNQKVWGEEDHRAYVRVPLHVAYVTWALLKDQYITSPLLVFVPFGIVSGQMGWHPIIVFVLNFIAIMPLAALLGTATECLSEAAGQGIAALLGATFGNAVELIVSIIALREGQIRLVQTSMLGSILSNSLFVLGCCFLAGGIHSREQRFNETSASTMASLSMFSAASLIIPATLYGTLSAANVKDTTQPILIVSYGTAVVLLVLYILYMYFQLKSHSHLSESEPGNNEPQVLKPVPAIMVMIIVTVVIALCADPLVGSVDALVETTHMSKTFVGLVLIPIVGNAAEHVTSIIFAYKGKMHMALNTAIGSSLQISLFVTPFMVLLGWFMGQPMTLRFQTFETVVLFLAVLIVNYLIMDGKSNYLEGAMCLGVYIIVALAFFVFPDDAGIADFVPPFVQNMLVE